MTNNNLLNTLIQHVSDIIICLKNDFGIFIFNRSAEKFYRWKSEDILGKDFLALCQENGYSLPISSNFFNNPTLTEIKQYLRNEKGNLYTINWSILPMMLPTKTHPVNGVLLIGKDCRIKKNNIAYHLDKIVACTPGSLYWKDSHGVYLGCNEFMVKTARLNSTNDIVGKTDDELWPETAKKIRKNDKYVIATGKTVFLEETVKIQDGTIMYFTGVKMPLRDENDTIIGIIGNSLDITKLKKTEAELIEAKEKAEEASLVKMDFIHNMEHDIRTPLSGIWGMINQFHKRETDTFKKELLHEVTNCAKELLDYCNGILDFSKIELGILSHLEKKFEVKKLIEKIIAIETPPAKIKEIDLTYNIENNIPEILLGDEYRLTRILLNLVGNAIKFTQEGYVKIRVSLAEKDDNLVTLKFIVQDSGMGIPKEKHDFIYEKFTRLSPSNKGLYKGLGLGLSIVKQFIEDMKGEVDLQSELGKGSLFVCTLSFKLPLVNQRLEDVL